MHLVTLAAGDSDDARGVVLCRRRRHSGCRLPHSGGPLPSLPPLPPLPLLRRPLARPGGAVQVDPIKPKLNAPGTNLLTLVYDALLSTFSFKFHLRHYNPSSKFAPLKIVLHPAGPRQGFLHSSTSHSPPEPFWSHLPVSPCLIDWGKTMHPTYPTKCAYVEPNSVRV